VRVGAIEISPVYDGAMSIPANRFFRGVTDEDWEPHRAFLTDDGMLPCDVGGFLLRIGDGTVDRLVLVDAGVGLPVPGPVFGHLLASLEALGVAPGDITDVVFTHLHFDHVGWATTDGQAVFPNATYRCDAADWTFFFDPDMPEIQNGRRMGAVLSPAERLAPVRDRFEMWDGDAAVLPGLDARAAPGHTPGSAVLVVSSGADRAVLLGDIVHCPVELLETDWDTVSDVDPALARQARETWARELEGTDVPAAAAHFPGMRFGRVLPGQGRRSWVFD
jgi:glyoxylase-like metal-dependent hydrolase (beta-lactamase superfamily II)